MPLLKIQPAGLLTQSRKSTTHPVGWKPFEDNHQAERKKCLELATIAEKKMDRGYCINYGDEYFCSDQCLHTKYSDEEYLEMYEDGDGDSYWTEWDEDDEQECEQEMNQHAFEPKEN